MGSLTKSEVTAARQTRGKAKEEARLRWESREVEEPAGGGGGGEQAACPCPCVGGGGAKAGDDRFAFFISYFREEAGCDCRLLQQGLQAETARPVFLDTTSADSISQIIDNGVRRAEALILVQTRRVLQRPWVLLEVFYAVQARVPVL